MIEVLALASAVSTIAGGISSAIQAGKDVNSIMPAFGKLASLEAEISIAESGRHKGPLGRLTSSEEEGFAIAQAKMKHKEVMDELRSVCRLFGPPGMWEIVVREQTAARIRRQKILDDEGDRLMVRIPSSGSWPYPHYVYIDKEKVRRASKKLPHERILYEPNNG